MQKNLIEVFVEKNCPTCNEVLSLVRSYAKGSDIEFSVFERDRDFQLFQERYVVICPATFVNKKLVFYGSFPLKALQRHIA